MDKFLVGLENYFEYVWSSIYTILKGMKITTKHFFISLFYKDFTMQYPDERPVVSERYRGLHILDIETCIGCLQCAKACPIDCIVIRLDRNKETKEVAFHEFSLDYNKCMFCHLCIEPCPVECIDMSKTFEFNTFNREDLVMDLRLPMHQYRAPDTDGGDELLEKERQRVNTEDRATQFTPGFNNTVFNILKSHESFEGQEWSRSHGRREFVHEKLTAHLTGLGSEADSGASGEAQKDAENTG